MGKTLVIAIMLIIIITHINNLVMDINMVIDIISNTSFMHGCKMSGANSNMYTITNVGNATMRNTYIPLGPLKLHAWVQLSLLMLMMNTLAIMTMIQTSLRKIQGTTQEDK